MNLSLSDYKLVDSFCELYNLSHIDTDYTVWARSIRYIYTEESKDIQRRYVKELKWSRCKKLQRPYLFERLMSRIVLKKREDQLDVYDLHKIEKAVKVKHGLEYCHHPCYSVSGMFKMVTCKCCESGYFVSQWYDPSELGDNVCSNKCASVFRLCEKLKHKALRSAISTRFTRAKGESNLQKFLFYLVNQQLTKRKKINRGKFTWT